jgi:hypothetical protein
MVHPEVPAEENLANPSGTHLAASANRGVGETVRQAALAIDRHRSIVVAVFFAAVLALAVGIHRDYGMSWDEELTRIGVGSVTYDYVVTGDPKPLLESTARYYGPLFEFVLVALERQLGLADSRDVYFMRHLVTFLIFYLALWFFYLICRECFGSWKLALLGCVFLILSPRLFADAFYNQKDIPFLALYTIATYTLIKFHERRTYGRAIAHALACAVLIDVRINGLILPAITGLLLGLDWVVDLTRNRGRSLAWVKDLSAVAVYLAVMSGLTILFWPLLWGGRIALFVDALRQMSQYPWGGELLYFGRMMKATELPWHYIPVWIGMTTPILYLVLFASGVVSYLGALLRGPVQFYLRHRKEVAVLCTLVVPSAAVFIMGSILYDAWRHMFFIYPAFLVVVLNGLVGIQRLLQGMPRRNAAALGAVAGLVLIVSLTATAATMIKHHPYQNVYFNALAGGDRPQIRRQFEMDYWGLSYREALEYILAHDASDSIGVGVANYPGWLNARILRPEERRRIRFVRTLKDADYFLSNYRLHPQDYPFPNEIFSINLDGVKIMVVYKLR